MPARWAGATAPAFVGRRRELAALAAAWSGVGDGARQVVFVGGEPGAGKSRLLAEAAADFYRHGAAVLLGTCIPELGPPYQPFPDLIPAVLPVYADEDGPEAAALVERLRIVMGGGAGDEDRPDRNNQRAVYDAVVEAFRRVAAQRPVVLALEDLHLAGAAGLSLLAYLVERTAECRILVLATHRTTAADRSYDLVHAIAALYRLDGVVRLDLTGLDTEEITSYLVLEAGAAPHRARVAATVLRDQTGGNPFFLRELWRDLSARGGLPALRDTTFTAPQSVRDTLQARLDRLAPSQRHVLELAAVMGDDFDAAGLGAAAASEPARTLDALDDAIGLGLVEPAPGTDGSFRFLHALARQAVLDLMTPSARARAHVDVAQVLEAHPTPTDRQVQRLAHHYASARALGYADRAVRYLVQAAGVAERSLAYRDAAGLFARAACLIEDAELIAKLRLSAARSSLLDSDFAAAREIYEQLATSGEAVSRMKAAIGYELTCWHTGRVDSRSVELLTTAMAGADRDPADPTYIRALAGLARALAYTGEGDRAEVLAHEAVEFARALGDDDVLADALLGNLAYGLVPPTAELKLAQAAELSRLAYRTGSTWHLQPAAYNRGVLCYLYGDHVGLEESYADIVRAVSLTRETHWDYCATCMLFGRQVIAGDFAGAERTCATLLDMGEAFGSDSTEGAHGVQTYMLRRETGRLEQVRSLITGLERPTEHWAPGLLALYTELGLREPTARLMRWVLDDDLLRNRGGAQWPGILAFLVEAAVSLEDTAAAQQLRPLLAEFAGLNLALGAFDALFGSADRYLGTLDSVLGAGSPEELFASALAMDERMHAPVHQAQTLAAHVAHLRRAGAQRQQIDVLVTQARALAEPLGLVRVLRMLEPPQVIGLPSARGSRPDGLTARELEVLHLLGEGLSNRGIAARLVISENTAANHVRNILAKTGSGNRTQAAMYGVNQPE